MAVLLRKHLRRSPGLGRVSMSNHRILLDYRFRFGDRTSLAVYIVVCILLTLFPSLIRVRVNVEGKHYYLGYLGIVGLINHAT